MQNLMCHITSPELSHSSLSVKCCTIPLASLDWFATPLKLAIYLVRGRIWSSVFSMCQGFATRLPPGGSILKHCCYLEQLSFIILAIFLWFLVKVNIKEVGMVTYLEWIELSCGESKHELKHGKVSFWAGTRKTGIVGCPSLHSHNTRKRFQHQEKMQ